MPTWRKPVLLRYIAFFLALRCVVTQSTRLSRPGLYHCIFPWQLPCRSSIGMQRRWIYHTLLQWRKYFDSFMAPWCSLLPLYLSYRAAEYSEVDRKYFASVQRNKVFRIYYVHEIYILMNLSYQYFPEHGKRLRSIIFDHLYTVGWFAAVQLWSRVMGTPNTAWLARPHIMRTCISQVSQAFYHSP